ncbi:hypothetical protein [Salipiger thiooxidans]|uniref:hypothetical protein n=1 Tax=Salipiger thiooxidans TaxID=282683 RepID=UPI001CD24F66|nr:hypothetical protein [Salipiger thiooxidans]MCA0848284.1 hypothetical protein [Salipiger thiooxidans]
MAHSISRTVATSAETSSSSMCRMRAPSCKGPSPLPTKLAQPHEALRGLGATAIRPVLADLPAFDALDPERLCQRSEVRLPATVAEGALRDDFLFHDEAVELAVGTAAPAVEAARPEPESVTAEPAQEGAPMRASAERHDDMMDRVGELLSLEARLAELAARSGDPQRVAIAEEIQRIPTGLRETTLSIRMTPIGSISGRFRRLVHDRTPKLGKPVGLKIEGQDTELDKTAVGLLADPLTRFTQRRKSGAEERSR